jgi:hypothetical protein
VVADHAEEVFVMCVPAVWIELGDPMGSGQPDKAACDGNAKEQPGGGTRPEA